MKFTLTIRNKGHEETWEEHFRFTKISTLEGARKFGDELLESWNRSLSPGDKPRELVEVKEGGNGKFYRDDCPHCEGTGKVSPDCLRCGGTGWSEDGDDICPDCHNEYCQHCR